MNEAYRIAKPFFEERFDCPRTFDDDAAEVYLKYPSILDDDLYYPVTFSFFEDEDGQELSMHVKAGYISLPEFGIQQADEVPSMNKLAMVIVCNEFNATSRWVKLAYEEGELMILHDDIVTEESVQEEIMWYMTELSSFCDIHYKPIRNMVKQFVELNSDM